ncbi:hypothetical protein J4438_00570 [Candidatus Woesearchaeota archaeon]|nr:hypothetical protein [Candidatus Woesearchaeota archaeon]
MVRKSKKSSKLLSTRKYMTVNKRAGLVFAGIVSLILGWILWEGVLTIEQSIAILLYIAGALKILWGLFWK